MYKFCESLFRYRRRPCRTVKIGPVEIGSGHRVAVQSMCTTDTLDTSGSVAQAIAIADAGGEIVRYTAQGRSQAENLRYIKEALRAKGYDTPLVADIHFNPAAAEIAARHVEKVRINPGNFIDGRATLSGVEYSDEEYDAELKRLDYKFTELLDICRDHGTVLRIGVNHGSLSDRIMSRYGDTVEGMVASAMEFLAICRRERFEGAVVSMKSSNTQVMVRAYRMMVAAMAEEGMDYPLHLGVTEAGEGEDGRIRSAVGIGALMADGLGDTIRVSLTEAPEAEIPVARQLVAIVSEREGHAPIPEQPTDTYNPYDYRRRASKAKDGLGGSNPIAVLSSPPEGSVTLTLSDLTDERLSRLKADGTVIVAESDNANPTAELRAFFLRLDSHGVDNPVIISRRYGHMSSDELTLRAAVDCGSLFIDGYGDGLMITCPGHAAAECERLAYGILQAARVRFTRTEYISCPGCGRTLFALGDTLRRVKEATAGLKGIKIAVMGCIVNGPGEMADADYGYVGAGPGRITLYKGKEPVKTIPEDRAIEELIALLEENGELKEQRL
ncbi:MAG: (E)-4-hydroxy-3-methylbut-2-enyl-diphosphate synthase [Rikenellaceae bacterium]|nr:(E)-4-hydroxy-3-methylbut-2-enyl-diphosphate synthase [Rikenellaceae bacterium]